MLPRRIAIALAAVVLGLIVLARTGDVLVDWLWFSSLGYADVFWTLFATRSIVFFTTLAVAATMVGLSGWLALRHAMPVGALPPPPAPPSRPGIWWTPPQASTGLLSQNAARLPWRLLVAAAALLLGLLAAAVALASWDTILRLLYAV